MKKLRQLCSIIFTVIIIVGTSIPALATEITQTSELVTEVENEKVENQAETQEYVEVLQFIKEEEFEEENIPCVISRGAHGYINQNEEIQIYPVLYSYVGEQNRALWFWASLKQKEEPQGDIFVEVYNPDGSFLTSFITKPNTDETIIFNSPIAGEYKVKVISSVNANAKLQANIVWLEVPVCTNDVNSE